MERPVKSSFQAQRRSGGRGRDFWSGPGAGRSSFVDGWSIWYSRIELVL